MYNLLFISHIKLLVIAEYSPSTSRSGRGGPVNTGPAPLGTDVAFLTGRPQRPPSLKFSARLEPLNLKV